MSDPVVQVEELRVERAEKTVLHHLSFEVREGEIFALLGGNGAGKSTMLLTLLGFLTPSGGRARVRGHDVVRRTSDVRRLVAYLPETAALYPHLSARENVNYLLSLARTRPESSALEGAFDRVGLGSHARGARLDTYSKGMRQKVAIALALLRDTPLLLLDEPTSGLDPGAVDEFHALMRELADTGRTVFMVTHDVFGACQIADRVGVLRGGRLSTTLARQDDGPIAPEVVRSAFIGEAAIA